MKAKFKKIIFFIHYSIRLTGKVNTLLSGKFCVVICGKKADDFPSFRIWFLLN